MNRDTHNDQKALRNDQGEGKGNPVPRLSRARVMPCAVRVRSCTAVVLSEKGPVIVHSRRDSRNRIHHAVVPSAEAGAGSTGLADTLQPGTVIVGCVPARESLTLWLNIPLASVPKAEKVLPSLLDVQLPFPLESCHYQVVDIRRMPDGTTQALVVAARRESLRARVEAYQARQVDPVLLDHEGLALWTQSRQECPLPADGARVILHGEDDHVTLVIGHGEQYRNAYSLQVNLPALTASADSRAILEGLVGRLRRILRAELQGESRVQWMASGVGAKSSELIAGLHQALAVEWQGPLTLHQEPETFLARALGARALTRGPFRCNLRMGELVHPFLLRQFQRRALTTAALFLAAGVLLCGINLTWRLLAAHRMAELQRAVSAVSAVLAPGARIPYGQEVREAQKATSQRAERERPFLDALAPSLGSRLAELIHSEASERVREGKLQGVAYETLTLQRNGFLLTGASDDWDVGERLAGRLKALGYTVKLERQEAVAEARVRFSIKGEKTVP